MSGTRGLEIIGGVYYINNLTFFDSYRIEARGDGSIFNSVINNTGAGVNL